MELKKYIMTLVAFGLLASNASAHSAGITPKVTEVLVTQYLEIQQALAQDDLEQAKLAANEYRNEEVGLRGGSPLYRVNCPTGNLKDTHLFQQPDKPVSMTVNSEASSWKACLFLGKLKPLRGLTSATKIAPDLSSQIFRTVHSKRDK